MPSSIQQHIHGRKGGSKSMAVKGEGLGLPIPIQQAHPVHCDYEDDANQAAHAVEV